MKFQIEVPFEMIDKITVDTLKSIYDLHKKEDQEVYSFPVFSLDREENAVKMAELYHALETVLEYLGSPCT